MIEKEVMGKWNFSGQLSPNLIEVYQLIIKCLIVGFLPTIKQLSIVIQSYYQGNIIFPPLNYNCVHFLLPLAIITRLLLKQNMNLDIKSPSFWNYFYCFNFMHGSTIYIINNTFVLKIMWLLDLLPCPLHTVTGMGQHQWQVVEEIYPQTYLQEKMLNTKLDALTWLCVG